MNLAVVFKSPGEQAVFRECLFEILDAFPEFTWGSSRLEAYSRICYATESIDRCEVIVRDPDGTLLGFAVLVDDDDDHVGECLGVQWRYIRPEARGAIGRAIQREILKIARKANHQFVAYTKRLGDGRYEINYTRLKEKPYGQED
ncbi:hypothetical protein Kompost2_00034 [Pseudomonas phage vB_PpuP-Kompost-2]